jgi:hypothetical protein
MGEFLYAYKDIIASIMMVNVLYFFDIATMGGGEWPKPQNRNTARYYEAPAS